MSLSCRAEYLNVLVSPASLQLRSRLILWSGSSNLTPSARWRMRTSKLRAWQMLHFGSSCSKRSRIVLQPSVLHRQVRMCSLICIAVR